MKGEEALARDPHNSPAGLAGCQTLRSDNPDTHKMRKPSVELRTQLAQTNFDTQAFRAGTPINRAKVSHQ